MSAGIIKAHQNTFSTVFRLIDVAVITSLLLVTCYMLDVVYINVYLFLLNDTLNVNNLLYRFIKNSVSLLILALTKIIKRNISYEKLI